MWQHRAKPSSWSKGKENFQLTFPQNRRSACASAQHLLSRGKGWTIIRHPNPRHLTTCWPCCATKCAKKWVSQERHSPHNPASINWVKQMFSKRTFILSKTKQTPSNQLLNKRQKHQFRRNKLTAQKPNLRKKKPILPGNPRSNEFRGAVRSPRTKQSHYLDVD
ncbi:hypothetical protein [Microviridae sp.]|nr:hypothetical protein [Microviridae sp.]